MSARLIPYGRHSLGTDDIQAVLKVLESDWLTQGPMVQKFEEAFASYCGARHAVAVSSGTAALHLAALAAGFASGDEIITSPITFVASANCVAYVGARPVFADIDPQTGCIDVREIARRLTPATKGIIPVHFAGQPCDLGAIAALARENGLTVVEDAAHALGSSYLIDGEEFRTGCCAHSDMTIFSLHPVKHIAAGEGGVITTNDEKLYQRLCLLRSHGITRDVDRMETNDGPWYYEMQTLGFNYRITDFQCALALSQLKKLDDFVARRRAIALKYRQAFENELALGLLAEHPNARSSYHLFVILALGPDRAELFRALRKKNIGVNVHYIPVHLQPFYRENYGYRAGDYPLAEEYYRRAVTIPLYPAMSDNDVNLVIEAVCRSVKALLS
ncbi:MAG: UDP-4-amino-4,6-dideoxy-N-acetyl-beta-L-altrosamine transaminase [Deltaproteobacteria bacterium]|nr:MAG: UDP-4-amino-4,6-dideoxy-N-acetyl-beta-L-altrosamine transaminase [Deltaproteobacteria bacterium]